MDSRFFITRPELQDVQMDCKRLEMTQRDHSDRLRILEKRLADDAALRSVWNSPFPNAISNGTPQHGQTLAHASPNSCVAHNPAGPVHMAHEVSDDLDEQGQNLLGTLHLASAEDEPSRRGAASRANSVRFDESALHGAGFGGQGARHLGEYGPIRPSSGMSSHHMMERSLSHKSDGRHSSTGHSVHSGMSRASSLALDTTFMVGGNEDESPLDLPPPGMFYLGSAPSIIRCWVTSSFTSSNVLYAVVSTGSQKSTIDYTLVKELDLLGELRRDTDGVNRIALPVFLAEATVTQSNSRSASPVPQMPSFDVTFEVVGSDQALDAESRKSICIVVGSHALRMYRADLLFSQNLMTLVGSDRDKLSVPFVRPDDDSIFMHLTTINVIPERPKLNATAPVFVSSEHVRKTQASDAKTVTQEKSSGPQSPTSQISATDDPEASNASAASVRADDIGSENRKHVAEDRARLEENQNASAEEAAPNKLPATDDQTARSFESTASRRGANMAARSTPWRMGAHANGGETGSRENTPWSGYQPANRAGRMKVLRPSKSGRTSTTTRTGPAFDLSAPSRAGGEARRKGVGPESNGAGGGITVRWGDGKRSFGSSSALARIGMASLTRPRDSLGAVGDGGVSNGSKSHSGSQSGGAPFDLSKLTSPPRTANNPLGNASAFSWAIGSKTKTPATTAE